MDGGLTPSSTDSTEPEQAAESFGEVFDREFPRYLALGMSAREYWEEDCHLVVAYREADRIRQERDDQLAWIQGYYIYEALCSAAPLFRSLDKRPRAQEYPQKTLTQRIREHRRAEEEARTAWDVELQVEASRDAFAQMAAQFNRMKKGGKKDGGFDYHQRAEDSGRS